MIYNKEPILVMWDFVKSLKSEIEIYKEQMNEDADNIPESYLLLRSCVNDTILFSGDGKTQIRKSDCDFILVTKGMATNSTDKHNKNKADITDALNTAGFKFSQYNLGYDDTLKSTQHTWSGVIDYII